MAEQVASINPRIAATHTRKALHLLSEAADLVRAAGKLEAFDGETAVLLHLSIAQEWLRGQAKKLRGGE